MWRDVFSHKDEIERGKVPGIGFPECQASGLIRAELPGGVAVGDAEEPVPRSLIEALDKVAGSRSANPCPPAFGVVEAQVQFVERRVPAAELAPIIGFVLRFAEE